MNELADVNPSLSGSAGVSADQTEPPRGMLQRKLDGWCTYSSACPRRAEGWPDPTQQMCRRHRLKVSKRVRETRSARRAESAAQGKCVRCRKPSETYRCPACRILDRCSLPKLSGSSRVSAETADRQSEIAAATRTHEDGRTRYHGQQKRGQQPKWQLNLQDLRHVMQDFEQFAQGIVVLATPQAQQKHKSDRVEYELAVAKMGDSVSRRMDDILERLGHFKVRQSQRDE